jgi:hypothetical protein
MAPNMSGIFLEVRKSRMYPISAVICVLSTVFFRIFDFATIGAKRGEVVVGILPCLCA